jgi:hypothetical protein
VVSVTDPYGRILGFLDRSRYSSIKQLLSGTRCLVKHHNIKKAFGIERGLAARVPKFVTPCR